MDEDRALLGRYVQEKCQDAFAALARRHVHWVYSCALRQVGDGHLAEDVTQAVFILLARKATRVASSTSVTGWLFRTVRLAGKESCRGERRRRIHEQRAREMRAEQATSEEEGDWEQIKPQLDAAVSRLGRKDRDAVLLRFYRGLSYAEVGSVMGIGEEAAKKRVQRAVKRLRGDMASSGMTLSCAGLGFIIEAKITIAAPGSLVQMVTGSQVSGAGAAELIAKGTEKMMAWAKVKVAAIALVSLAAMGGAVVVAELGIRPATHATALTSAPVQGSGASADLLLNELREIHPAIRSVHVRIDPAEGGVAEAWAIFTGDHQLLKLRMDFPQTEDGPKVMVWEKDKAVVWFKRKNAVATLTERNILDQLSGFFQTIDPKPHVDLLMEAQNQPANHVTVQQPTKPGEPIIITLRPEAEQRQTVFTVNAKSHLVERIETYAMQDGGRALLSRSDYSDYDSVDPKVFTLEPPKDAIRVDSTAKDVGLEKGAMSDNEIATKVAREFVEAMIALDYAKAGKLCGGVGAETMKEQFGRIEYVRLIRVGEPYPDPDRRTMFVRVPAEVEVNAEGRTEVKSFTFGVRPIYGQMSRWAIQGGI